MQQLRFSQVRTPNQNIPEDIPEIGLIPSLPLQLGEGPLSSPLIVGMLLPVSQGPGRMSGDDSQNKKLPLGESASTTKFLLSRGLSQVSLTCREQTLLVEDTSVFVEWFHKYGIHLCCRTNNLKVFANQPGWSVLSRATEQAGRPFQSVWDPLPSTDVNPCLNVIKNFTPGLEGLRSAQEHLLLCRGPELDSQHPCSSA